MIDKQIVGAIKDLMANPNSSINQFEKLNNLLLKSETVSYESNLRCLIVIYLENPSAETQSCVLELLITCVKRGLFQSPTDSDLANLVLNVAQNTDFELSLKAFSALEAMIGLHLELFETRTQDIVNIIRRVVESDASSLQKMNALNMLHKLVTNVTLNSDVQNTVVTLWVQHICPLMFNLTQTNLQTAATDISNLLLPTLQNLVQSECFNNFLTTVEKTYLSIMTCLVAKEEVLYSKLWIFVCKLLAVKFHQGFQVVNMLLTVVESAFKSQNTDIRLHAFFCWQSLIESFLLNPETFFTEKRVKLLTLPLKANNGRSENLVQVKFTTWCKLLNALDTKNISFERHAILEQFLQFCFGPLCEQSLFSWNSHGNQISQGKKYSSVHLMSCRALLQLFGLKMYIDNELQTKLEYFTFKNPKLSIESTNSKIVIDSVGESCVLLSQMQSSDRFECAAINEALWKSLCYRIDNLKDDHLKQKCCEQLAALILALIAVARKRSTLITFGLIPLFDIIVTNEFKFFKNENMSQMLFVHMVQAVMKKDKALLQYDVIQIFKKIFVFKSDDADFLKFVQIVLDRFSLNVKENLHPDKLAMLQNIWLILEEELKQHLSKLKTTKTDPEMSSSVFFDFLMWPVTILNVPFNQEKIYLKWKELYYSFGLHTSETLLNKLGIKILQNLHKLWEKGTHNLIIANITYFIVNNLNLKDYNEDHLSNILEIFTLLKSFVFMEDSSNETLKIFVKSMKKIFNNSKIYPFCLEDQILDCVNCLLSTHKNEEILEDIASFAKKFPNPSKYKSNFEKLAHILQQSGVKEIITDLVLKDCLELTKPSPIDSFTRRSKRQTSQSDSETLENRKRSRKSTFKSKEYPENIIKKPKTLNDLNDSNDKAEKQQIFTLLGHDVDTMSPVTLKSSFMSQKNTENTDLVFINTPYKFDPKKLTKTQREKLSKRQDDIPALYADLSQSQSNTVLDNSNSFSESIESKPEAVIELIPNSKTEWTKPADESENLSSFKAKIGEMHEQNDTKMKNVAVSELVQTKPEEIIEYIPKSKAEQTKTADNIVTDDDCKVKVVELERKNDTKTKNVAVRTIGRRKSLNLETVHKLTPIARRKSTESDVQIHKKMPKNASVAKKKRAGRKSKTEQNIILSETNSIDSTNEPDVLNTAQVEINSADLNSANLENIPLKPEKKKRGRKTNESTATPSQSVDTDPDIPDIVKTRIKRELKRIQMDINDSEDYRKSEKRKTRTSSQRDSDSEGRKSISPVNNKKKTTELQQPTAEQNKDELIKTCKIPVLYRLEAVKQQQNQSSDTLADQIPVSITTAATVEQKICESDQTPDDLYDSKAVKPASTDVIRPNYKKTTEEPIAPTVKQNKNESDELIKNCKIPVLYRLETVKSGEHLTIDNTDVIEDSQLSSPLKIFTETSEVTSTCQNFENSDTQTINSEFLTELDVQAPEVLNLVDISCRKVLFNTTTEELSTPKDLKSDIASSPIFVDTPTRNKKLIQDTLEISPIKNVCTDVVQTSSSCSTEVARPYRKKTTLKSPGGRSAHILDMVSAKNTLPSPKNVKKPQQVKDFCFSPTQNRIMKMMEHLEKNPATSETDTEHITEEDILVFRKQLPSPFASPSGSILKKRKLDDVEESALRVCKRRKVNFSDPPVSCRKFIEKNSKQKCPSTVKIDFIPQEARVTRSSSSEDEPEPVNVEHFEQIQQVEEKTSNEVSVITKNAEFAEMIPDVQSDLNNSPSCSSSALNRNPTSILDILDNAYTPIYDLLEQKKIEPDDLIKGIFSTQLIQLLLERLNAEDVLQLIHGHLKSYNEFANFIPKPEETINDKMVKCVKDFMQNFSLILAKEDN